MRHPTLAELEFEVLPGQYAVTRLEAGAADPAWLPDTGFTCVVRTPKELSVVCREFFVPETLRTERGWRCLGIAGTLDFSMTGILAQIATVLADEGISLFAISTFDTDYFLVREEDLNRAMRTLQRKGSRISPVPSP